MPVGALETLMATINGCAEEFAVQGTQKLTGDFSHRERVHLNFLSLLTSGSTGEDQNLKCGIWIFSFLEVWSTWGNTFVLQGAPLILVNRPNQYLFSGRHHGKEFQPMFMWQN